jgi:hypothetical protein
MARLSGEPFVRTVTRIQPSIRRTDSDRLLRRDYLVVVVVVVDELDGDVVVGVSDDDDDAGGVTMTVLAVPESPLSPFGPSGPVAPGGPGGPGVGTVTVAVDGGVLTTAGGLVTTVGRSHAISPIDASRDANNSEDFIAFSIRSDLLKILQFLGAPMHDSARE